MKKIQIILACLFINLVANAQSPVIDLKVYDGSEIPGFYLKDINNILNTFEGTWLYTNGNTSLKIVLVKKTLKPNADYFEDLIIGEYQYVLNGVQKFNSLSYLTTAISRERNHKIAGNHIHTGASPFNSFTAGEVILKMYFEDNLGGNIFIRKINVGGQEAIQIFRRCIHPPIQYGEPIIDPIGPTGFFTLIKQ